LRKKRRKNNRNGLAVVDGTVVCLYGGPDKGSHGQGVCCLARGLFEKMRMK
jgi:hypothetical protein